MKSKTPSLLSRLRESQRRCTELLQRQEQLAGIIETAMDAIVTTDAQQRIVVFNQAASRMFRLPAEQALGQPLDSLLPAHLRQAHHAHVHGYASSGSPARQMGEVRALIAQRADGEEFPIEASISRVGEGDQLLMTVLVRDVTRIREAEAARQARLAAEAANRAKTEFLSRMSHELRTPLNAVLGMAQLLEESTRGRLTPHEHERFDLMRVAGTQLRALIDDVLDLSRIESGQITVSPREVELCGLLDSALAMSASHAAALGIQLQAAYRSLAPLPLQVDPIRLRQIVLNLISNGIKYHRADGFVRVELAREPDAVRIRVVDNGLGMTPAQQATLFQPFNRLGRERSGIEGTGIGMALTRQLADLMGGHLRVESQADVGTTVHVSLPLSAPQAVAAVPAAAAAPPAPPPAQLAGVVLYIEDNAVNALLVKEVLRPWPQVRLVVADTGRKGIEQARALQPDLVLLDMHLPDIDGIRVLELLQQDAATRSLRVAALSASAMPDEVAAALRAGAVTYWTKPIDFGPFLDGVRSLLEASGRDSPGC